MPETPETTFYDVELIVRRALAQGHAVAMYTEPNRTRSGAFGLEVYAVDDGRTICYWEFDGCPALIQSLAQFADDLAYGGAA